MAATMTLDPHSQSVVTADIEAHAALNELQASTSQLGMGIRFGHSLDLARAPTLAAFQQKQRDASGRGL